MLAQAGSEHELLAAAEAGERWPMPDFDIDVLWHSDAEMIDAERSLTTVPGLAATHRANLHRDWEVERTGGPGWGFLLTSRTGQTIRTAGVVLCAGGWLPDLLERVPDLLERVPVPAAVMPRWPTQTVRQEQAYHFPYREAAAIAGSWPAFIHAPELIATYGLPSGRDASGAGQKVAEYREDPALGGVAGRDRG